MLQINFDDSEIGKFTTSDILKRMVRARKSALSSLGWWIRGELRNHIEYGGSDWPGLHPISTKFRKKRKTGNKWFRRRRPAHESPVFWLGKFARYRINSDGTLVDCDFGKSKRGQLGTFDPQLVGIVKRTEKGERIRVTEKMRKFFGTQKDKLPKRQKAVPGQNFFPLKKTTKILVIPKRPIFAPVERKIKPLAPTRFRDKFIAALERYASK